MYEVTGTGKVKDTPYDAYSRETAFSLVPASALLSQVALKR
jgi:hypothetical protein